MAMLPSSLASTPESDAAAKLISDQLLNQTVIVHIPDGRAFRGTFLCIDDGINIILANTDELRPSNQAATDNSQRSPTRGPMSERNVGMVMIPGKQVVGIEVEEYPGSGSRNGPLAAPVGQSYTPAVAPFGWPDDPDMYT